jgi:hypothetical protein
MLQGAMWVWFVLTAGSIAFVVWDSISNGVTSWVQRIAWILVTVYTGPLGLFMYLLACRRPFVGGHERFTEATWKQGFNSEMHCVAGDATGIIFAAMIVPVFGLSNGWDLVVEYSAGFVSGLFIFQALMMAGMYGGKYFVAVRKTFFSEAVSMNMVMVGMIPTMIILASIWPNAHDPLMPEFWFHMSLATIVGTVTAFPINYWLVKNRLKHGCMTLPGADAPAPGLGHKSPEMANMHGDAHTGASHSMHDSHNAHGDTDREAGHEHETGMSMDMGNEAPDTPSAHEHSSGMNELSLIDSLLWIGGTLLALVSVVWITAQYVPISFS